MASVHVLGATGMVGRALVSRLAAAGWRVTAVGRNAAALAALPAAGTRLADLADAEATAHALADARRVVSCAYVRHAPTVLACLPGAVERVVVLGYTRMWTRFADRLAAEARAAAAAFEAVRCPGFMLHPTLIYGPQAVNGIGRLAAWIAACPLLPLPGGGRALIQPIHVDDVCRAIEAALERPLQGRRQLVVAGPAAVSYAAFAAAVAAASGRRVRILPAPLPLLAAAAFVSRLLPGLPSVEAGVVRRLGEDKAFDIADMRACFGFEPMALEDGLARSLPVQASRALYSPPGGGR